MTDKHIIELVKGQTRALTGWTQQQLTRHETAMSATQNMVIENHLRIQALAECLAAPVWIKWWGIPVWRVGFTKEQFDGAYRTLRDKFNAEMKQKVEEKIVAKPRATQFDPPEHAGVKKEVAGAA